MLAVVVSRADRASEHIGEQLLAAAEWTTREDPDRPDAAGGGTYHRCAAGDGVELRTFDALHLDLVDPAAAFDDPDWLAFASRHAGDTGPLLTAHATGNFGPADYGGTAGDLAEHAPNALARVLAAFDEHAPDGYGTAIECTHHGPSSVGRPSLFVEVGSGEAQWDDSDAAAAAARAILDCAGVAPHRERTVVGFGGGHYAPRFERIVRETDWAVGHVAADWGLDAMGDPASDPDARDTVRQAFERSKATRALIDGDRPAVAAAVASLGYRVVSETWLRETTGVPLSFVADAEDALGPVDEGLRFGARAAGHEGSFATAALPADLLAEAVGIDRDAVREAVHEGTLAYDTAEGGTRVAGPVALRDAGDRDALVDALADVLATNYDEVVRADGAILARESAFDPERARTLGVPEGPAFGRLASGEAVEVDGETVEPDAVRVDRERRFPVSE
jgi:D-aminoacyl-tRNA deacylase